MAPTIIVGDDETPAEVAARLLDLADDQRDVQLRTDVPGTAYRVPDGLYAKYTGRSKRSDTEQRLNAVDQHSGQAGDVAAIVGDDTPAAALHNTGDPADLTGDLVSDEQPRTAVNVEPPQNGEPDAVTAAGRPARAGDGDQGDEQGDEQPKPRKATARKATSRSRATKATPAAAGDGK